jgi:RNA polymerase sigma-70 factor (ECF subfamily)
MNHRTSSPQSALRFGVTCDQLSPTAGDYTAIPTSELIRACADGEAAGWQEFIRRFHRIIATTACRVARRWGENAPEVVDDLVQDTYLKLCAEGARVLREFDSPHPFVIFAFLKIVTSNVANDYFKRLHAGKRGGGHAGEPLENAERTGSAAGPANLASIERAVFLDEVDAFLSRVGTPKTRERDKTIFWLYYRQGLTAKEIVDLPFGLSLKGVESTLRRLTQLVRTHLVEPRRRGALNLAGEPVFMRASLSPHSASGLAAPPGSDV